LPERGKRLVDFFLSTYPSFLDSCRSKDKLRAAIHTWNSAIKDLTDEEVRKACEYCKNSSSDFIPSVGRFRHKAKGLPDSDEAYILAKNKNYSHPAIAAARIEIPSHDWSHDKEEILMKKFKAVYGRICEKILAGNFKLSTATANLAISEKVNFNDYLKDLEKKYGPLKDPAVYPTESKEFLALLDKKWPINEEVKGRKREYHLIRRQAMIEINDICYKNLKVEEQL
jgi:hypothetical protein